MDGVSGVGWSSVMLSLASLGVVCLVAWGALRLLAGRGVGKASGVVRVVARCPLEPRRSVYVVEAVGRSFLIGVGDGPMTVLAELDNEQLKRAAETAVAAPRFAEVLARALGSRGASSQGADAVRRAWVGAAAVLATLVPAAAHAGAAARAHEGALAARPLVLIVAMAALSLIPFVVLMMTSFVRISVVLSILRSAIGTPSVPPTQVLTGLALVLTLAVMAPTGERIWSAVAPIVGMAAGADLTSGETIAALETAADRGKEPLREFMLKHTAAADRASFQALALKMRAPVEQAGVSDRDFGVLVPAFVTSELRRAFQIGFLLFIPFLVVDMVIANLLLALGMHMLSPTTVSLPFKLLLFVLADGWNLVVKGLLGSYS